LNPAEFCSHFLNRCFPRAHYNAYNLEQLKMHTLSKRRNHFGALLLIQISLGRKPGPSLLETDVLLVPARFIKHSFLFDVCSSSKNSLSGKCSSAANVVCKDVDVIGTKTVSIKTIL
jgi:hypothetical protein